MNTLHRLHPAAAFFYFLAILLLTMLLSNPLLSALSLLGGLCFLLTAWPQSRRDCPFYALMFLLITLTNPLFSHNGATPLFFLNGNAITLEALTYGAGLGLMLVGVMIWCKVMTQVMTSDKLAFLFGKVLPQLGLVLSMALRYLPLLRRQAKKISRAQKVCGMYSSDSRFDRLRASLRMTSALIGWSMEHAVELSKAMQARGYGLPKRSSYSLYHLRPSDGGSVCLTILCAGLCLLAAALGGLHFAYYPRIPPLPHDAWSVLGSAAFGLLAFLPFFMELGERIKWNYYRSKI